MKKLTFNVLFYDFNAKKLITLNIFNNIHFSEGVDRAILEYKETKSIENFTKQIDMALKYSFWSKREYELSIGDAFETNLDKYEKIDVYQQVSMNLDILIQYIIDNI